jgi:NhaA family Na+:H+ antiporter
VAAIAFANRSRVGHPVVYVALALGVWAGVLASGVHATIAGVVAALTVPTEAKGGSKPLEWFEHRLVNWNIYFVIPLFGFANAGITLSGLPDGALFGPLTLAIAAGLVIGKQAGIFASVFVAERLGLAHRPRGASWGQVWGASILCGIGFTMSLFIGALAFPRDPVLIEEAKLGVLVGSLVSAVLGFLVLRFSPPLRRKA